jgi:hypothetical protein
MYMDAWGILDPKTSPAKAQKTKKQKKTKKTLGFFPQIRVSRKQPLQRFCLHPKPLFSWFLLLFAPSTFWVSRQSPAPPKDVSENVH